MASGQSLVNAFRLLEIQFVSRLPKLDESRNGAFVSDHLILACHQSAPILPRAEMAELDVVRQRSEQRNAFPDQDRSARDGDPVDQSSAQKFLHRSGAIDVDVLRSGRSELVGNLQGSAVHLLCTSGGFRKIQRTMAQHHDALVAVRPARQLHNHFERVAADENGIDAGDEFVVSVGLAAIGGQKVVVAVGARDKPSRLVPTKTDSFMIAPRLRIGTLGNAVVLHYASSQLCTVVSCNARCRSNHHVHGRTMTVRTTPGQAISETLAGGGLKRSPR